MNRSWRLRTGDASASAGKRTACALAALALLVGCADEKRARPPVRRPAHATAAPTETAERASLTAYYCKYDGRTLVPFAVPLGEATDTQSVAYLATVAALNGPKSGTEAIRFPKGTAPRSVRVNGATATVDLSRDVARTPAGGFAEAGEFKALVWTLTGIAPIRSVRIRVAGAVLPTLPGGHFELDEPLSRADW